MPLSPSLRPVDYALAIARHGGLTAAAEALHVSQPALSVALAGLEARLGQRLFHRRKGAALIPTAFGQAWLARAGAEVERVEALFRAPGPAALRLALFEDLAPLILAPLTARGETLGLDPVMPALGFQALAQALHRGTVDAAVTWDLGLAEGTPRLMLAEIAPSVVVAEDHPLAGRTTLRLADLAGQDLVLADQDLSLAHWQRLFARAGMTPRIARTGASLDLMRAFAAHGLGLGLSYAQPAPRLTADGRPFRVLPLTDAGREALVLAMPGADGPPAAPGPALERLARFLTPFFVPAPPSGSKSV